MSQAEVVVIGAGVIGLAIARRLALGGVDTLVLERDQPGVHASWAAAGMLSPLAEADGPGPFLSLLRESRDAYREFSAALVEETGTDVGYRDEGTILVALTEEDEARLEGRYRWQNRSGLPVERVTGAELRDREPLLSHSVRAGLRFPEDHQVDNRLLGRALEVAAARAGAEIRTGTTATKVLSQEGRVRGVLLADGGQIDAEVVVVAAGSWAGEIAGLPRPLPVAPVRGQLLAVRSPEPPLQHVIHSARIYLVPRADGRLIIGATVEQAGFTNAVTPAGVLRLLGAALEAVPAIQDAPLVEWWSGLRPGTPDGLPILGPDPELTGLLYATGHYRNGILLAPITAEIIAALIAGTRNRDLSPFSIERFRGAL